MREAAFTGAAPPGVTLPAARVHEGRDTYYRAAPYEDGMETPEDRMETGRMAETERTVRPLAHLLGSSVPRPAKAWGPGARTPAGEQSSTRVESARSVYASVADGEAAKRRGGEAADGTEGAQGPEGAGAVISGSNEPSPGPGSRRNPVVVHDGGPGPAGVEAPAEAGVGASVTVAAGAEADERRAGPLTMTGIVHAVRHGTGAPGRKSSYGAAGYR